MGKETAKGKRKPLITDYTIAKGVTESEENTDHEVDDESVVIAPSLSEAKMLNELEHVHQIMKETETSKKITTKNCQEVLSFLDKIRIHLKSNNEINKISAEISSIKNELEKINETNNSKFGKNNEQLKDQLTYSEITKLRSKSNDQQLLSQDEVRTVEIKVTNRNDELSSNNIKSAILKEISPSKLKVQIFSLRPGMKCVYMKVRNQEQAQIITSEIENKMPLFDSEIVQKIDPCIKVVNINKATATDELIQIIIRQNHEVFQNIENVEEKMKILTQHRSKFGDLYHAVIRLSADMWKSVLEHGYLYVEHNRCKVFEYIPVTICYKCNGYSHLAKDCKVENDVCSFCSGPHHFKVCPNSNDISQLCCPSCSTYNEKIKNFNNQSNLNRSTDHKSNSTQCPSFVRMTNIIKMKTNYGL